MWMDKEGRVVWRISRCTGVPSEIVKQAGLAVIGCLTNRTERVPWMLEMLRFHPEM